MSGIGGGGVGTSVINPFAPIQTTTTDFFPIPPQTSTFDPFINPATTPTSTPTPSQSPLTISKIVTETLPNPSSSKKLAPTFTGTNRNNNNNNNNNINSNSNTISTAAIIFSIMIGFIIVGGCIALILARAGSKKKKPIIIEQRNLFGDEANMNEPYNQINSISPPLNLPPPPPQRSPPSSPQRSPHSSPRPSPPSSPRLSQPSSPRFSSPRRSQLSSPRRSTHSSPPSSPRRSLPSSPRDSQSSPPPSPRRSLPLPLPPLPLLPPIPQHTPIVLYRNPSLMRHGSSRKPSRNYYDPVRLDPNYPYQKYSQLSSQSTHNAEEQTNIDEPP